MSSFSLADPTRFEDLFKGAGFTNVRVVRDVRGTTMGSFEEYWASIEAGIGSIPQSYLLLTETDRRAVREEVQAQTLQFEVDGDLHMSVEMLIGSGQKDQESISAALPASNRSSTIRPAVRGPSCLPHHQRPAGI